MYNGIGTHGTLKGTGLSGYVQHSRAVARTQLFEADATAHASIDKRTQLEKMRSQEDNEAMARRLEEHNRRRAVEVQVLEFEEAQRAKFPDLDDDAIDAQCYEYKKALLTQLADSLRKEHAKKMQSQHHGAQGATGQKTSTDFAIAFGVGQHKHTAKQKGASTIL